MFQVNIEDLLNNKFQLMIQETKLLPNIIDKLYYWEYEYFIKLLNKHNKDEKEERDKQEGDQSSKYNLNNFNPSKMMGNMSSSIPKMPKF